MSKHFYRASQITSNKNRNGKLPISLATLWRWSKDPTSNFPKPIKLNKGTTVWDATEIDQFIERQKDQTK